MNPVNKHTLVSDLIQPGPTEVDHAPVAVDAAITLATVVTGHLPNNASGLGTTPSLMAAGRNSSLTVAKTVPSAAGVEQAPLDEIPTPEQMWGQGG